MPVGDTAEDRYVNDAQRTAMERAEIMAGPDDLDQGVTPWLVKLHKHTLMYRLHRKGQTINDDEPDGYLISFSDLQRMRLRKLQAKLVQHVVNLRFKEESSEWDCDLHQYVQVLQDYEYMVKFSGQQSDPFVATAERCVDSILMNKAMRIEQARPRELPPFHFPGLTSESLTPITIPRSDATSEALITRIAVAAGAGLFLIAPMWIMVLHNTLWTGLATTTAFVAVFGLSMAYFLSENIHVLSISAAYAAVLVVFVGLTTSP
ncbi:hypothetical protein F5Y05DRAFT_374529 [Hypoxylon sp. FL0543]|nr:hypothetical protein F5Y05DRAFT_374529 [Hypoxylon sp. FL0543]